MVKFTAREDLCGDVCMGLYKKVDRPVGVSGQFNCIF